MNERNSSQRKKTVKELIDRLHRGATLTEVLASAREVFAAADPQEISRIEEELIKEGMPREEVLRLCDVHMAIMKETKGDEKALTPPGHPVHILMEEHRIMLQLGEELKRDCEAIGKAVDLDSVSSQIEQIAHNVVHLKDSENHYLREENILFPLLEKHGFTEPPAVMWTEHNGIREIKKGLYHLMETRENMTFPAFAKQLTEVGQSLAEKLSSHFFKENNILFPAGLKVLSDNEWADIREQFDDFGYCLFTPEPAIAGRKKDLTTLRRIEAEGVIPFETGALSWAEIELLLNTLPVDVTFVDKDDTVRYFSQAKDRIFPRTKAIIGLKVQNCHPQKSVHAVGQILDDFRNGRRDNAEFWLNLSGRLVYIRYFAVRDKSRSYVGCLEVTQDITDIKKIEGEKRLL